VVCPAFLRESWAREIRKFSDLAPYVFTGSNLIPEGVDVIICSYSQLKKARALFQWANNIVADEVHYLKNLEAQRTQLFHEYIQTYKPERFIGLSGTAIKNRVPEWFSLLALCSYNPHKNSGKNILDRYDYWSFCRRFCHISEFKIGNRLVTKFEGHKNVDELRTYLEDKYIRRKASEVLDLPPIIRKDVVIDDTFIDHDLLQAWNERANAYTTYKRNSSKIKIDHTVRYAKDLYGAGEGPLVIFSDHVEPVQEISRQLKNSAAITGSTPMGERDRIVQEFQAGKIDYLVATIGSLSVGVTLTRARNIIFNDLSWIPADIAQAEKRIHRIGQKGSCVIHRIFWGKVDVAIGKTIEKKLRTLVEVL